MDEEEVTMVSKKMETENIKQMETEVAEEVKQKTVKRWKGKGGEIEGHCRHDSYGLRAAKPEARPQMKVLRPATRNQCFIGDTLFNGLKDKFETETSSVLTEKVSRVLANP